MDLITLAYPVGHVSMLGEWSGAGVQTVQTYGVVNSLDPALIVRARVDGGAWIDADYAAPAVYYPPVDYPEIDYTEPAYTDPGYWHAYLPIAGLADGPHYIDVMIWDSSGSQLVSGTITGGWLCTHDSWHRLATFPLPHGATNPVEVDGKIYIMGGHDGSAGPIAYLGGKYAHAYDPATNTWARLADAPWSVGTGMCVEYGGYVYLFNGINYPPGDIYGLYRRQKVARYNPADDTWQTMTDAQLDLRLGSQHAAVKIGTLVYFFGAEDNGHGGAFSSTTNVVSRRIPIYDLVADSWSYASTYMPDGRSAVGAVYWPANGLVYLFGGVSSPSLTDPSLDVIEPVVTPAGADPTDFLSYNPSTGAFAVVGTMAAPEGYSSAWGQPVLPVAQPEGIYLLDQSPYDYSHTALWHPDTALFEFWYGDSVNMQWLDNRNINNGFQAGVVAASDGYIYMAPTIYVVSGVSVGGIERIADGQFVSQLTNMGYDYSRCPPTFPSAATRGGAGGVDISGSGGTASHQLAGRIF